MSKRIVVPSSAPAAPAASTPAFSFLTVQAPPSTAPKKEKAKPKSKRFHQEATVLHVYPPVDCKEENGGTFWLISANLWNYKYVNAKGQEVIADVEKWNPYLVWFREQPPAVGTRYNLPWGANMKSRRKALQESYIFNAAFHG